LLLGWANWSHAVNCERNPNHAQCPDGGGGGGGGGEDPTIGGSACAISSGTFPAAVYQLDDVDKRGRVTGTSIYATNSDLDCSVLLLRRERVEDLSFKMVGNEGLITWVQSGPDNAGRKDPRDPTVKLLRFSVTDKKITTALPLSSTTPYFVPEGSAGFSTSTISDDGNSLYVAENEGLNDTIVEVDISNGCSKECPLSPAGPIFSRTNGLVAVNLVSKGNRIYFGSLSVGPSEPPEELSYIEEINDQWSDEVVIARSTDVPLKGASFFSDLSVINGDVDGDGITETVVATAAHGLDNNLGGVYLINVDDCASSSTQSCLAVEDAFIAMPYLDQWDLGEFLEGDLIVRIFDNNDFERYDFDDDTAVLVLEATNIDAAD
jgi:hypothetical protein